MEQPTTQRSRGSIARPAMTLLSISGAALLAGVGLVTWALFWPVSACGDPACVRHRFSVAVEIDAFAQVPPIQFELESKEGPVSLQSTLRSAGIEVDLSLDQLDLPYKAASGALDRADLYQFVSTWRNASAPGSDAQLYALLTTGLVSDKGEPLFGIMFDVKDRESFAVAPPTTTRYFGDDPQLIATLQLRTFMHELLHALNRHHSDGAALSGGLTLEAPTRCIANSQQRPWILIEPPLMALSPATIRFFQTAASRDILPGVENSPFERRQVSPTECQDVRATKLPDPLDSRWAFAMRRIQQLFAIQSASAAENTEDEAASADAAPQVELMLQAQSAAYPLGYPIGVRVMARNLDDEPLPLVDRLNPGYGILRIEYRRANDTQWQVLQPLTWFEPVNNNEAMLAPGAQTEETVPVYFGDAGWTFDEPGEYQIRGRLQMGEARNDALSTPLTIHVEAPRTPDDAAAAQPLIDTEGRLDNDVGRLLSFGGRIGDAGDLEPVENAIERYGHTALGSALRLTLLSQRLRPPIDPLTGERPAADFGDAIELLQDTCSDSAIAALTSQLLQQRPGSLPATFDNRVASARVAWEGARTDGSVIATYSDPSLSSWGPSVHFCFNESELRGSIRDSVRDMGRLLRREPAQRIVVVGHSDFAGTCRYNDSLALRRAQALRDALVRTGIERKRIEVVSLGERRPLDFAANDAAHDLNRRVEVLIERTTPARESDTTAQRIEPRCAPRQPSSQENSVPG